MNPQAVIKQKPQSMQRALGSLADIPGPDTRDLKICRSIAGDKPEVLTSIYEEDCNLAVWQRMLAPELEQEIEALLQSRNNFNVSLPLSPQSANSDILRALETSASAPMLANDICELVDMFCFLFDVNLSGLRLRSLEQPMCPRFHVDHVTCRLITTYRGPTTQWLPHKGTDRSKLGRGNGGRPDESSGLFQHQSDINQALTGDVLLLKGERWQGNEGTGLVHRSPKIPDGGKRLLLTLDLI